MVTARAAAVSGHFSGAADAPTAAQPQFAGAGIPAAPVVVHGHAAAPASEELPSRVLAADAPTSAEARRASGDSLPSLGPLPSAARGGGRPGLADALGAQLILSERVGAERPRVDDRYVIEGLLGQGGFGVVCRARNRQLDRTVALKLVPRELAADSGVVREARALAKFRHANIVSVYAVDEGWLIAGDHRYAVAFVEMQLVDGESLRAWLRRRPPALAFVDVMIQVARAMAEAHQQGVLHRDLKPENVMVSPSGEVTVIDFGLAVGAHTAAHAADSAFWRGSQDAIGTRVTQTGYVRGTPAYMAPEAHSGKTVAQSDQFALAVMLREGLTGTHPLVPKEDQRDAPVLRSGERWFQRLRRVIDRGMAQAIGDRFPTMLDFARALERERVAWRRRAAWIAIGLTAGLLGVAALAYAGTQALRDSSAAIASLVSASPSVPSKPPAPAPAAEPAGEPQSLPAPPEPEVWEGLDRVRDALPVLAGPQGKPAVLWGGSKILQVATDSSLAEAFKRQEQLKAGLAALPKASALKTAVVVHRDRNFFCTLVLLPEELADLSPRDALWKDIGAILREGVLSVSRATYCRSTVLVSLDDGSGRPRRPLYRCDAP